MERSFCLKPAFNLFGIGYDTHAKVASRKRTMSQIQELRNLYKKGQGRRELFDLLATYEVKREELLADRAAELTGLGYETVVKIFKELDALDIGAFTLGRKGAKTRIIWAFSPRSVGEVAKGGADRLDAYFGDEPADSQKQVAAKVSDSEPINDTKLLIAQTKRNLAVKLGISPDQITITINLVG